MRECDCVCRFKLLKDRELCRLHTSYLYSNRSSCHIWWHQKSNHGSSQRFLFRTPLSSESSRYHVHPTWPTGPLIKSRSSLSFPWKHPQFCQANHANWYVDLYLYPYAASRLYKDEFAKEVLWLTTLLMSARVYRCPYDQSRALQRDLTKDQRGTTFSRSRENAPRSNPRLLQRVVRSEQLI